MFRAEMEVWVLMLGYEVDVHAGDGEQALIRSTAAELPAGEVLFVKIDGVLEEVKCCGAVMDWIR